MCDSLRRMTGLLLAVALGMLAVGAGSLLDGIFELAIRQCGAGKFWTAIASRRDTSTSLGGFFETTLPAALRARAFDGARSAAAAECVLGVVLIGLGVALLIRATPVL